jgi:hypothetical protein
MITFPISATLDRESRGEFWKYCGETFMVGLKAGMAPEEARRFAIDFTNEKIKGFVERQSQ